MPALPLPTASVAALALAAAVGARAYWRRTVTETTLASARRGHALLWLLAGGAVAALHAAGASFGPLVPSFEQFALAYLAIVVALTVPKAVIKHLDLRPEGAMNPILAAESPLERAFFVAMFVPHVVLWFALPAVALPDAPLVAGALSVGVVALPGLSAGAAFVAVRSARTVASVAAFHVVLAWPGAGVGTAVAAVAAAHVLYVAMALSGLAYSGQLGGMTGDPA